MRFFTSLYRRLVIFLIVPLIVLLVSSDILEYSYLGSILLAEWQQANILRLEKAAREIDGHLSRIRRIMENLAQTGETTMGMAKQEWLLEILQRQEGVKEVRLVWPGSEQSLSLKPGHPYPPDFASPFIEKVAPPSFLLQPDGRTVWLRSELTGRTKKPLGYVEVVLDVTIFLQRLEQLGWHLSNLLCLVDTDGRYVLHPDPQQQGQLCWGPPHDDLEPLLKQAVQQETVGTVLKRSLLKDQVVGFVRLQEAPWTLLLHTSSTAILGPYLRFRFSYVVSSILSLVIILALLRWCLGKPLATLRQLAETAAAVARGQYGDPLPVTSYDEIGRLAESFNTMLAGLKERDFLTATFGRYVDAKVAQQLLRSPLAVRLGGQKREVAILMTDIRGFTPLAETLTPEMTIIMLNQHFAKIIDIVQLYDGIIVDFFGDSVLAFFDPFDEPVPPVVRRALKCALQIQTEMVSFRGQHPEWPPLTLGVGLHVGEVVVGNIGSETRTKYGIVGSAVNLTHRIQSLAQDDEVIISEAVFLHTHGAVAIQRQITTCLKGFRGEINLFVVTDRGQGKARHNG